MSQDKNPENEYPTLTPFEAALASLAPRVDDFDREKLFYDAGRASVLRGESSLRQSHRAGWGWPIAFSAMSALAAVLLVALCTRSELGAVPSPTDSVPEIAVEPVVIPSSERNSEPVYPIAANSYSRLRAEILRHGVDAYRPERVVVAEEKIIAAGPVAYRELLSRLLNE